MLQRLFRTKSAFKDYDDNHTKSLLEPESWSPTKLGEDQLRILICQDVGDTYKSVLYDSSQDVSLSPGRGTARGELARSWNGSQGFYTRPNGGRAIDRRNDGRTPIVANRPMSHHEYHTTFQHSTQRQANRRQDLIGDMIFGTAPLAYKGMNTKVHCKRDKEPQLVLSKVFTINPRDTDVTRRTSFSSVNSDWSTASSPVGAPYANEHTRRSASSLSVQLDDNVSELSSDDERCRQSPYQASPPTHHPLRSKRSCRFSQTSIENGSFRPMPLPTTPVFIEPGSLDSASTTTSVRSYSRNTKYALAIIITVDEKDQTLIDFIFSHFQLIENHLHHLQSILAQTLSNHFRGGSSITSLHHQSRRSRGPPSYSLFQNDSTLLDGISNFKRAFYDLYGIPRIQTPLWLNMCTFPQRKAEYAQALIRELIWLIDEFDNKAHHFIVSTCITAVLMYHLSWVHTVAPPEEDMTTLYQHGNYDPLWAQLSDLYGYVGTSTRITRTIVVGERASLVRRILFVLTYLIRCNEIYENIETVTDPVSPGNIFAREYAVDDKFVTRLEDRIARQLMGSTTDVESIAIPRAQHQRNDEYQPSESPESLADRSTSTSSSSTPNMTPAGQWSADDVIHERVDQPDGVAAASALLLPERQGDLNITMPSDAYLVPMLKSTVCRMTPDITRLSNDEGASIEPAHKLYAKSYGRSLMATYCDTYKSDFVLMGVPNTLFINQLKSDLERMLHQFSLSDSVNVATGLIIDTNICRCYALHQYFPSTDADDGDHKPSRMEEQDVKMSSMVRKLLLDMKKQNEEGAAADQLLDAFEDGLQLIYLKSLILHERLYLNDSKILFKDMEIDEDDIPLLAHVCSCYSRKTAEVLMNPAELKH